MAQLKLETEQYVEKYRKLLPLYAEMLRIGQEQQQCLFAEELDLEKLNRLIARRQELMERIVLIDNNLLLLREKLGKKPACNDDKEYLIYLEKNSNDFADCRNKLKAVLAEIKRQDQKNRQLLQKRMDEARENLKKTRGDKKALKSYGGYNNYQQAAFLDQNI